MLTVAGVHWRQHRADAFAFAPRLKCAKNGRTFDVGFFSAAGRP